MNKKKFRYRGLIAALLMLLPSSAALATLQIDFPESVETNRIQFYWSGDPNAADQDGRIINTDAGTTPNLSDPERQAKVDAVSDASFHFFADEGFPGSKTTILRLWDAAAKTEDALYTETQSWANPPMGTEIKAFTKPYAYRYSAAGQAYISMYDETGTVNLYPEESFSKSVTFKSYQSPVDGYNIQLKEIQWKINGVDQSGSATLKLETPGDDLSPGTSYTLQVRHKSYVGDWGPWSSELTYTVGEGPSDGAVLGQILLSFIKKDEDHGVNTFSVPFAPAHLGTTTITTLDQLIEAINAQVDGNPVRTFGTWDPQGQIAWGWTFKEDGTIDTYINTTDSPAAKDLEANRVYQAYVDNDVPEFTLTSQ